MKAFIGTKIILAEPMNEVVFQERHSAVVRDITTMEARPGYHVVYSHPDGVPYHSWSPKDVFERAYRPVADDERNMISVCEGEGNVAGS